MDIVFQSTFMYFKKNSHFDVIIWFLVTINMYYKQKWIYKSLFILVIHIC